MAPMTTANRYECNENGTGYSTVTAAVAETEEFYPATVNYRLQKMNSSVGKYFNFNVLE